MSKLVSELQLKLLASWPCRCLHHHYNISLRGVIVSLTGASVRTGERSASCAPSSLSPGQHLAVNLSRLPHISQTSCCSCGGVPPTLQPTTRWFRYGRADSERSSAPHSPNGGVSEDAIPQFHLCVGVSVHGRDHGSAVPQLHVPLRRRPDLAGAHAPLHARTVRARAAHPHLHPPGPEQRQTAHSAVAHLAARSHRQVSADMFTSVCQTGAWIPLYPQCPLCSAEGMSLTSHRCRAHGCFFFLLKTCQACQRISCLQMVR